MKNNILTNDVLELFDRNHITANTLRKFVVESVADFLGEIGRASCRERV